MGPPVSCRTLSVTCIWRILESTQLPRWYIDDTHMVLVKTHDAQEFTDHINSIDDDIKWMTEGKVSTHTQSAMKR